MKGEEFRKGKKKNDNSSIVRIGRVTVEEVMSMKEFEGITKKEAKKYINVLEQYCLLMCQLYLEFKDKGENDQNMTA